MLWTGTCFQMQSLGASLWSKTSTGKSKVNLMTVTMQLSGLPSCCTTHASPDASLPYTIGGRNCREVKGKRGIRTTLHIYIFSLAQGSQKTTCFQDPPLVSRVSPWHSLVLKAGPLKSLENCISASKWPVELSATWWVNSPWLEVCKGCSLTSNQDAVMNPALSKRLDRMNS